MKLFKHLLCLAALLVPVLHAEAALAGNGKTDVCHYAGPHGKVVYINVSDNAVAAHLAHGDDLLVDGECTTEGGNGGGNGGGSGGGGSTSGNLPACIVGSFMGLAELQLKGEFNVNSETFTSNPDQAMTGTVVAVGGGLHELTIIDDNANELFDEPALSDNWSVTSDGPNLITTGVFTNTLGSRYSIVKMTGSTCGQSNAE